MLKQLSEAFDPSKKYDKTIECLEQNFDKTIYQCYNGPSDATPNSGNNLNSKNAFVANKNLTPVSQKSKTKASGGKKGAEVSGILQMGMDALGNIGLSPARGPNENLKSAMSNSVLHQVRK